jgi:hypothetical protein
MSFDQDRKYGEYKNKKYTLKENTSMSYIPSGKYVAYKFVWDELKNKYVMDKEEQIGVEKADYIIKDFYYPYEFNMSENLIKKIHSYQYDLTTEITSYRDGHPNLLIGPSAWGYWKKLLTSIANKQLSYQFISDASKFINWAIDSGIIDRNELVDKGSKIHANSTIYFTNVRHYQNIIYFNRLISQQIIQRSQKFTEDIVVFSGQSTWYRGDKKLEFKNIQSKVGDILSYYVPISTSTDLSMALTFFLKTNQGAVQKSYLEKWDIKLHDVCCVYKYILPAGYPIYNMSHMNVEDEILLPCFFGDKINTFQVIDKTIYPIRFNKEWGELFYQGNKEKYNSELEDTKNKDIIETSITIITCKFVGDLS